jgi:ribosomal protein L40E
MSVYYVQRTPGAGVEGPAGIGRLVEEMRAGSLPPEAMVCLAGSQDWTPAGETLAYAAAEAEALAARRQVRRTRRLRTRPRRGLSWAMAAVSMGLWVVAALMGGLLAILLVAMGLGLFAAALLIDRRVEICGDCGTRLAPTARICPACGAEIVG